MTKSISNEELNNKLGQLADAARKRADEYEQRSHNADPLKLDGLLSLARSCRRAVRFYEKELARRK